MLHSFVDESKDPSYLLAAALIRPAHLNKIRSLTASMVLPGQRRVHFNNERDSRRAQIMRQLTELPIEAVIYEAAGKTNEKAARDKCLTALIRDHLNRDAHRLVLEHEESRVDADRHILRSEIRAADKSDRLVYEHMRGFEESLLVIPDALGWCWARGGHWRVKAKQLVTNVFQA